MAGPASGVHSVLPFRSLVYVCVNAARWMTVRVTLPLESKYVVVRRTPWLWIVNGNAHAVPAGNVNVLSTFSAVTVGGAAPAVAAVAAAVSTTAMKPRAFTFMLPPFDRVVEGFDACRRRAAVAKTTRAMQLGDCALR